jgi:subtilase family serine protease
MANWYRTGVRPYPGAPDGSLPAAKSPSRRNFRPQVEVLEDRLVPAGPTAPISAPPIIVLHPSQSSTPPTTALTPAQIRHAYGIDAVTLGNVMGNGAGQTIAIVDAGDNPGFVDSTDPNFANSDLAKFDAFYGLPDPPSFMKVNENGGTTLPPSNVSGFAIEEALDIEWAHVVAPEASIILVEATTASDADLIQTAVPTAASLPGVSVVSMSFGGPEFSGETSLDSVFQTPQGHQGVTFLASTGDSGAPGGYPAYSPNVVAVGGTTLMVDSAGNYQGESGWSDGGGGISQFEPQPSFQNGVVTQSTTQRTIPDVSMDADPDTGVAVYDSFDNGAATPWVQVGGTSLACPLWAGIIAITNQDRVRFGLGSLDGPKQTLPMLYSLPEADFHDITTGNNGFPAGPGYDLVTGRGSPNAPLLIPGLAGVSSFTGRNNVYHPFRYIVDATLPPNGTVVKGNFTVINDSNLNPTAQFAIILGPLPEGVSVDPSTPTVTLTNGDLAIPLPVLGLPPGRTIRVTIKLRNPNHVSLGTFFEGFTATLTPVF